MPKTISSFFIKELDANKRFELNVKPIRCGGRCLDGKGGFKTHRQLRFDEMTGIYVMKEDAITHRFALQLQELMDPENPDYDPAFLPDPLFEFEPQPDPEFHPSNPFLEIYGTTPSFSE